MKPYQQIPIQDCGELLIPIPPTIFALTQPHVYVELGAPYGELSPYYLRQGVVERLIQAQNLLQQQHPDWRIQIFDAYRPVAVQQFMVDHVLAQVLQETGLTLETADAAQKQQTLAQVQRFWAIPSRDPATPPPHSTGAAVDVTLVSPAGPVEMGSPIDEMSPRSFPDHFATAETGAGRLAHQNRKQLYEAMIQAGFEQHPQEWWHFSYGDQLWAWLTDQRQSRAVGGGDAEGSPRSAKQPVAQYGAAEPKALWLTV